VRDWAGFFVLVRSDERFSHVEPAVVWHIVGPFRVPIVVMLRRERPNVMKFAVVVPCDDLRESRAKGENSGSTAIQRRSPGNTRFLL
jgi:hypothetical protein